MHHRIRLQFGNKFKDREAIADIKFNMVIGRPKPIFQTTLIPARIS